MTTVLYSRHETPFDVNYSTGRLYDFNDYPDTSIILRANGKYGVFPLRDIPEMIQRKEWGKPLYLFERAVNLGFTRCHAGLFMKYEDYKPLHACGQFVSFFDRRIKKDRWINIQDGNTYIFPHRCHVANGQSLEHWDIFHLDNYGVYENILFLIEKAGNRQISIQIEHRYHLLSAQEMDNGVVAYLVTSEDRRTLFTSLYIHQSGRVLWKIGEELPQSHKNWDKMLDWEEYELFTSLYKSGIYGDYCICISAIEPIGCFIFPNECFNAEFIAKLKRFVKPYVEQAQPLPAFMEID